MSEPLKLIVGLGNPGREYEFTRHNIGFRALDVLAQQSQCSLREGHKGLWAKSKFKTQEFVILKPMTYMNVSGESVVSLAHFFKVLPENVLVIHDELEFPLGTLRLKVGGGDGGHNGLKSITQHLGSSKYSRLRFGIGRPPHPAMDPADYVLASFQKGEEKQLDSLFPKVIEAIEAFLEGRFLLLMNVFNSSKNV